MVPNVGWCGPIFDSRLYSLGLGPERFNGALSCACVSCTGHGFCFVCLGGVSVRCYIIENHLIKILETDSLCVPRNAPLRGSFVRASIFFAPPVGIMPASRSRNNHPHLQNRPAPRCCLVVLTAQSKARELVLPRALILYGFFFHHEVRLRFSFLG